MSVQLIFRKVVRTYVGLTGPQRVCTTTLMRMANRRLPLAFITLAVLVILGVAGPAFDVRHHGPVTVIFYLWDMGAGLATVALALLIIGAVVGSLMRRYPTVPAIVTSLFAALTLSVGSQLAQSLVGSLLEHPAFRYITPAWGLWLAFTPSVAGTVLGVLWMRAVAAGN